MQYIIIIAIVLGLALSDFITGVVKGYVTEQLSSAKMRRGGLNKLVELLVMATACGLEIGIRALGEFYSGDTLAEITGAVTAVAVFVYIVVMELISILENYAAIDPQAAGWVSRLLKRLKSVHDKEDKQ